MCGQQASHFQRQLSRVHIEEEEEQEIAGVDQAAQPTPVVCPPAMKTS